MIPYRNERESESDVPDARVRLEDGHDAHDDGGDQPRLVPEPNRQRRCVGEHIQLKDEHEECVEVREHLSEEVPVQADVWLQVRSAQSETSKTRFLPASTLNAFQVMLVDFTLDTACCKTLTAGSR